MNNLALAIPEIFIALSGGALLLLTAVCERLRLVSWLCAFALLGGAWLVSLVPEGVGFFGNMFITDDLARFSKIMILVVSALSLFLAPSYMCDVKSAKSEYAVLILFAALGMVVMVSAYNLLALYLGLELFNLALYVLVAFCRDDLRSTEAGMKYYILGAVSSAILLFGLSLLYGVTGGLSFDALANGSGQLYALGLAFVLAGFAFKLSAVPFHMWAPDVYEGAPTPVTAFLLAAPKIAAIVLLARVLIVLPVATHDVWQPMLAAFAVASMMLGALGGLAQKNIKRLMAYSAITNIGIMLVGVSLLGQGVVESAAGLSGFSGTLLYLALYFMGTFGFFAGVLLLRKDGQPIEALTDLSGLLKTHPLMATCLGACLFSLAGIPPLAGFFGKYQVLLAAVEGKAMWLAVMGVLASVVAAAYYLRVVKIMAFDPPPEKPLKLIKDRTLYVLAVLAALSVTLFMIMPAPLMNAAQTAAKSVLS